MDASAVRSRRILDRIPGEGLGQQVFAGVADEDGMARCLLSISGSDWEAMGRPDILTVTIEPGEHVQV